MRSAKVHPASYSIYIDHRPVLPLRRPEEKSNAEGGAAELHIGNGQSVTGYSIGLRNEVSIQAGCGEPVIIGFNG
jgi:hypothetical protein